MPAVQPIQGSKFKLKSSWPFHRLIDNPSGQVFECFNTPTTGSKTPFDPCWSLCPFCGEKMQLEPNDRSAWRRLGFDEPNDSLRDFFEGKRQLAAVVAAHEQLIFPAGSLAEVGEVMNGMCEVTVWGPIPHGPHGEHLAIQREGGEILMAVPCDGSRLHWGACFVYPPKVASMLQKRAARRVERLAFEDEHEGDEGGGQ